jgi:1,4-alpha-glucan branching enzyme
MEAALAITLLAPMVPMLFMGEEWGSKAPFPFFCDFHGDLAKAVREGRRREFAGAYAKYGDEIPDPLEISTMQSAALDWPSREQSPGRQRLALVQKLLAIRQQEIIPRLDGAAFGGAHAEDGGLLTADWRLGDGTTLSLTANLANRDIPLAAAQIKGTPIWGSELTASMPPWAVSWRIG